MTFGDCTFLNQIMSACRYHRVRINVESIGAVYGISESDLLQFGLIYLGQPVVDVVAAKGLLDATENEYYKRRWQFMRDMLRLNFRRVPAVVGLDACLKSLIWPASVGVPLKTSDISFLEMVTEELFLREELPGFVALTLPERIKGFLDDAAIHQVSSKQTLLLRQLASRLRMNLMEMLRSLKEVLERLRVEGKDRRITAKLVFVAKPKLDVAEFMGFLAKAPGLEVRGRTSLVSEAMGSYEVVLETSLMTLVALQVALWLLNGCVVQIIELKSRLRIVSQKRLPKVIRERALLQDQDVPKWIAVVVQNVCASLTTDQTRFEQAASDFDKTNVQRVEIKAPKPNR
jgi:uncharacterized membrane protein